MFKVSVLGVLGAVVVSGCTSSSCASCTFCTSRPSPGGGSSISYPSENIKLVKTRERGDNGLCITLVHQSFIITFSNLLSSQLWVLVNFD